MERENDSEVPEKKRVGRPRVEQKADPASRTVRIPLQVYDEMTTYIGWLQKKTGKTIDRKDLLMNSWRAYRDRNETASWGLITGKRRMILLTVVAFLAKTPEGSEDARLVDSLLATTEIAVRFSKKLRRLNKLVAEAKRADG